MESLQIHDWHFDDPRMEYVYITDANPPEFSPAAGIEADLSPEARRAREYELDGYAENPISFKFKEKIGYLASDITEIDEQAVRSTKLSNIEIKEPGWIFDVRNWWETYRREDMVHYETKIPLNTIRAIMEILKESGELAPPLNDT